MFVIRELMHCKPGKVRGMVDVFKGVAAVMEKKGIEPFRIMTDVAGEQFWTVVLETNVESLAAFLAMEEDLMGDPDAAEAMAGYHDLVENGSREIYKLEG